jgi:hypothetical protein
LDVAIRRARRFGRGGNITEYSNPGVPDVYGQLIIDRFYNVKIPVLNPGLADIKRILNKLEKLESHLYKIFMTEGREIYEVDPGLLPLDLQAALKEAVEIVIATILSARYINLEWIPTGSLLITCDPRAVKIEIGVATRPGESIYNIYYSCKSHMDDELELHIWFQVDEDDPGKPLVLGSNCTYRVS